MSLALFWCGRKRYKIVPPEGNVVTLVACAVGVSENVPVGQQFISQPYDLIITNCQCRKKKHKCKVTFTAWAQNDCDKIRLQKRLQQLKIMNIIFNQLHLQQVFLFFNLLSEFCLLLQHAIKRRCSNKNKEEKKEHWMDWAEDKYGVCISH